MAIKPFNVQKRRRNNHLGNTESNFRASLSFTDLTSDYSLGGITVIRGLYNIGEVSVKHAGFPPLFHSQLLLSPGFTQAGGHNDYRYGIE